MIKNFAYLILLTFFVSTIGFTAQTLVDPRSISLTNTHIIVGGAGAVGGDVALSGAISITNAGVTSYAGTVPVNKGGTGQATQTAGFNALSPLSTKGDTLAFNGTDNVRFAACADGNQIQFDSTQVDGIKCVAGGTGGTVTSVALSDGSGTPIYTISGSPVTTSGTLTFTLSSETANTVFAGPTGGGAVQPNFRSLVAADIPSLPYASSTLTSSHIFVGSAGNVATDTAVSGAITINNTGVTSYNGVVPVAKGGTNSSTALNNNRVMQSSGGAIVEAAAITGNKALASDVNGIPVASATTDTELGFVSGVTSSIQTQLNAKQSTALTSAHLLVGSAGNVATDTAITGAIAITNAGVTSYSGTVPINKGGTGQTTQTAGFDALSPTTTKGDLIVNNGTNNVRQAVGTDTFVLTADSSQTTGVKWAAAGGGSGSSQVVVAGYIPAASGCHWDASSSNALANFGTNASCSSTWTFEDTGSGVTVSTATGTLPQVTFTNLAAGRYEVIWQFPFEVSSGTVVFNAAISDGTSTSGVSSFNISAAVAGTATMIGHFNYGSTQGSLTYKLQAGGVGSSATFSIEDGTNFFFTKGVYLIIYKIQ